MKITCQLIVIGLFCISSQTLTAQVEKQAGIVVDDGIVLQSFSVHSEDGATVNRVVLPVVTQRFMMSQSAVGSWAMPHSYAADGFSHMHDPSVRKDLEIVGEQYDQIRSIQKEFQQKMNSMMKEYSKAQGNQERVKDISLRIQDLQKEKKTALSDVLLPHQQERLKQVSRQLQMQNMGTARALQNGEIADELEVSAEQKKKLGEIQAELQKKLQELDAETKTEAKKRLLQELTEEQRKQLKDLTGDEFKRNPKDWQNNRVSPTKGD